MIIGTGLLVCQVFWSKSFTEHPLAHRLFLCLGLGILINYVLALTGLNLDQLHLCLGLLAAIGWFWAIKSKFLKIERRDFVFLSVLAIFLPLYFIQLILQTNTSWDGTFVWHFASRIMYYTNHLTAWADWTSPAYGMSHPDYPKMFSLLGAENAKLVGHWSEYSARLSLLVPFLLCLCSLFAFETKSKYFYLFVVLVFFKMGDGLWSACNDQFLAILTISGLWFWSKPTDKMTSLEWMTGALILSLLIGTKHEGLLIAANLIGLAFIMNYKSHWQHLSRRHFGLLKSLLSGGLVILGALIWPILRTLKGVKNDLSLVSVASLHHAIDRLRDPISLKLILKQMFFNNELGKLSILLLLLIVGLNLLQKYSEKHQNGPESFLKDWCRFYFFSTFYVFYFLTLFCIYLVTPQDLNWHLQESAGRTTLPILTSVLLMWFWLFSEFEILLKFL